MREDKRNEVFPYDCHPSGMSTSERQSEECSPSSISCVICGLPAKSTNLGVMSCRACANFFKRTHSLGKYYVCRQSDGKCEVRRDLPFLCRRCRFDKCIAVGMRLPKRRKNKKQNSIDELPGDDGIMLTTTDDRATSAFLKTVCNAFRTCFEKRRRLEMELWETSRYGDECVIAPSGETFYISTEEFSSDAFPSIIGEYRMTFNTAFPEFRTLPQKDQEMTISSTAASTYVLETSFLTVKHFPNSDRYSFISATSIFDNESCGSFVQSIDEDKEALTRAMKFYSDKVDGLMLPVLREAKLNEIEYHAALFLLTWSFDLAPWMPQKIVDIGEKIKEKVYEELNCYYKNEMRCEDIASRLGRLLMCVHAAQEAGVLLQEELQMYKLMGVFREDDLLLKFFL